MIVVHSSSPPSYAAWYTSTTVMSSRASYVFSALSSVAAMMRGLTLLSPMYLEHMAKICRSISSQDDTSSSVIWLAELRVVSGAPFIVAAWDTRAPRVGMVARVARIAVGRAVTAAAVIVKAAADMVQRCVALRVTAAGVILKFLKPPARDNWQENFLLKIRFTRAALILRLTF